MELLDGYLMAFTYTLGKHNGDGLPYQQVFRVDGRGKTSQITRRPFPLPYPDAWRYQNWLVSPVLFTTQKAATSLFSTYVPSKDIERPAVPRHLWVIAGILMLVSALLAVWRTQALSLPLIERIAWIIACGLIGIPAFLSLVLLYQKRERLDYIPLAHAATA
jgi:hypothetical protein